MAVKRVEQEVEGSRFVFLYGIDLYKRYALGLPQERQSIKDCASGFAPSIPCENDALTDGWLRSFVGNKEHRTPALKGEAVGDVHVPGIGPA